MLSVASLLIMLLGVALLSGGIAVFAAYHWGYENGYFEGGVDQMNNEWYYEER